ncbi:MAG: hypothetical protein M2R45_01297 [Verrucomicrobia subdivision 3 bacterium]|nr:hypothetical protein [Limisphaerales bacterium]MCS1415163.1 hypothetical protein [Limisphaerales bacterium]
MPPLMLTKVHIDLPRPRLKEIASTVRSQLESIDLALSTSPKIAVAVGSRGIANLSTIVRATIEQLKAQGAQPFIVPAMGSHGGATAEGQREVLDSYSINQTTMRCPVLSSMEVIELDLTGLPNPAFMDRHAYAADGIILINRIKPHTDFHGPYESGLIKMAVIGLGKEKQAFEMHRHGVYGLKELIPKTAERIFNIGKIKAGIGIIENAYDETAKIEVLPGSEIMQREPELLKEAYANMPRLPVDDIDILSVDLLGKDISGTGLDTNVIGRIRIPTEPEPSCPRIKAIWVSDLTSDSHGNATGMGLADVVTELFRSRVDFDATYTNIVTSGFLERAKFPIVAPSDRAAFELCHRSAGSIPMDELRVIRIRDTLHVNEPYVSDAILKEIKPQPNVSILGPAQEAFDQDGRSTPFEAVERDSVEPLLSKSKAGNHQRH